MAKTSSLACAIRVITPLSGEAAGTIGQVQLLLAGMLEAVEIEEAETLQGQIARITEVRGSCECGCGSTAVVVAGASASTYAGILPIHGDVYAADGTYRGGVMVRMTQGLVADLEVWSIGDDQLPFPEPDQVTWRKEP